MSQRQLDYATPLPTPHGSRLARAMIGVGIGVAVSLPALLAALLSAGVGHGDYLAASALYPVPLLLIGYMNVWPENTLPLLVCAQFPLYGLLIAWPSGRRRRNVVFTIAAIHVSAVCFIVFH